jgi:soluble lytic murein transglycosylase-like protein
LKLSLLALGIVLCLASPAAAQIYSWRDVDGKLVLSDKPRPDQGAQATFEVHGAAMVRATKPLNSTTKSAPFEASITEHAQRQRVAADLVRAVIQVESAFNPRARSNKGAMGLMQLMPATAVELGVTDAYDPAQNIRAGVAYLKRLLVRFSQNEELALAAYNAGPGAVLKYGSAVPPYRETRDYVKKIQNQAGSRPAPTRVYRIVEMKDGREVVRFTNVPPAPVLVASRIPNS